MLIAVAPVAGARLEAGATSQTIAQAEFAHDPPQSTSDSSPSIMPLLHE
eukprot:COSAG03_NODE_19718_length_331_cov_0.879310_1_plen_48_part_10